MWNVAVLTNITIELTTLNDKLRIGVIGHGRIGRFHAQHVRELAIEQQNCSLVAIAEPSSDRVTKGLEDVQLFHDVDALIAANVIDAAVVCSSTHTHQSVAEKLIGAGYRVLMEKPMTDRIESDRAFTSQLNQHSPNSLMLAFQRRFDAPLQYARSMLQENRIGRIFKIISILEDSAPPPDGYESPGLLIDMSVHNIDEVLWLTGATPTSVASVGSRVHNHRISSVIEDFDYASMHLEFEEDLLARIDVSRLHVPGYHVETIIYGAEGMIRVGTFQCDPRSVIVETLGRGTAINRREFRMREYAADTPTTAIPEFIHRFGPAYKAELAEFIGKCHASEPFPVDQNDGLRAGEIASAATKAVRTGGFQSLELARLGRI